MYFDEPAAPLEPMPANLGAILGVAGVFVMLFAVFPGPILNAADAAAAALF